MSSFIGRWDLTITAGDVIYPSWVEFAAEGGGSFVGRFGSARPVPQVSLDGESVSFSLPPQYEPRQTDLVFEGTLVDGNLVGSTVVEDGSTATWVGTPAPAMPWRQVEWQAPESLIEADLSNWRTRSADMANHWSIKDGALDNAAVGTDLISVATFNDFHLVAEYQYPAGSNSGIYLRGRYEFQIVDDFEGSPNGVGNSGAIYGFLAPVRNAILAPGEWNRAEITLVGRFVTVVLNGETVIDGKEIPGITGGALDSSEGEPGPIFVQGDHGPVTFRRLDISRA